MVMTAGTPHNASHLLVSETGSRKCWGLGTLGRRGTALWLTFGPAHTARPKEQSHPDSRPQLLTHGSEGRTAYDLAFVAKSTGLLREAHIGLDVT